MRDAILSTYEANETAARDLIPGRFLLPEDVATCVALTAEQLDLDQEAVADVLAAHWTMRASG